MVEEILVLRGPPIEWCAFLSVLLFKFCIILCSHHHSLPLHPKLCSGNDKLRNQGVKSSQNDLQPGASAKRGTVFLTVRLETWPACTGAGSSSCPRTRLLWHLCSSLGSWFLICPQYCVPPTPRLAFLGTDGGSGASRAMSHRGGFPYPSCGLAESPGPTGTEVPGRARLALEPTFWDEHSLPCREWVTQGGPSSAPCISKLCFLWKWHSINSRDFSCFCLNRWLGTRIKTTQSCSHMWGKRFTNFCQFYLQYFGDKIYFNWLFLKQYS